jgi:hypothetical protein
MPAKMFSPSVDVGEDLRQYARAREEEMQVRVAEYRKEKEQELLHELGKRIKEYEMKELLSENPHVLDNEPKFIRDTKKLCEKLQKQLDRTANTVFQPSPESIKESEYLCALFDSELEAFRFKIECKIRRNMENAKHQSAQVDAVGEEHLKELKNLFEEACVRPIEHNVRTLKAAVSEFKDTIERRTIKVLAEVCARVESNLPTELVKLAQDISENNESFYTDLKIQLMQTRRRTLLTLEKRIIDLSREFQVSKCDEVVEAEADYVNELTDLLLRYVGMFRHDGEIPDDGCHMISQTIDSLNMSHAARVRFILQFVKNFGDEQLFACIAQACGDVDDSISFRS